MVDLAGTRRMGAAEIHHGMDQGQMEGSEPNQVVHCGLAANVVSL